MAAEDKSQLSSFFSKDEKEAQKELDHLRRRLRKNETLKRTHNRTGFQGKTLWDWLQLLLIPLVLTVGGFLFSTYQHNTDQQQALDQQQATILQTYIDNIQDLLLNHNLLGDSPLPKNVTDRVTIQEVQELARSRTLTSLEGLDPGRKVRLVQFLFEAHLIGFRDSHNKAQQPIIDLAGADLAGTNFANFNLEGVNLSCANPEAEYIYTLTSTCVNLEGANLLLSSLNDANFSNDSLKGANLSYAILDRIDLSGADLSSADLSNATLSGVDLSGADLSGANLSGANLSLALNLTQYQLNQVFTCKGAFLPTGLTCLHNQ